MKHWTERYVGRPYVKDDLDCGGWVERILREQFGRAVDLPKERAQGLRPRSRQIDQERARFIAATAEPVDGDCVLMIGRGDLWHIGLFVRIQGEARVLHAMEGFGQVVLHRVRDLAALGLTLEGYYQWR